MCIIIIHSFISGQRHGWETLINGNLLIIVLKLQLMTVLACCLNGNIQSLNISPS